MKTLLALLGLAALAGNLCATPSPPWTGNPMKPGIAALTCTSSGDLTTLGQTEHVLVFLDIRDAVGCGAPAIVTAPTEWSLGGGRMYWPPVSPNNDWSIKTMGEVFGVDVGVATTANGNNSHVYVAAAGPKPCNWGGVNIWNNRPYNTSASNTGGGGEVWRVNGLTHAPFLLASLPNHRGLFQGAGGPSVYTCINGNSFVGLGQVSVNTKPGMNKIYVSNMDDGKIYTLVDGVFNSTYPCPAFDHGATKPAPVLLDDPNSLYTQRSRLIFGLEYHPQLNRLFYALRNGSDQDEIWSIGLDAVGCPTGTQCLEFVSASWGSTSALASLPSDIQFSDDGCRMLINHMSIRYEFLTVTGVVTTGFGPFAGPTTQLVPLHYAHTGAAYEAKFNSNPACTASLRWTNPNTAVNRYSIGLPIYSSPPTNSIAGDYGFGTLLNNQAIDSVVVVADVIRASPNNSSYKFGLEIHPLDDLTRTNLPLANFDVPLLSGNPIIQSTKIQLNDIDVLHKDSCMKVATSPVTCPVGAGGQHKMTINITNTSTVPVWGLMLTNCFGMPMLPGTTPITPVLQSPSPITLGNPLLPGDSTGPLVVCLPGIPPAGGTYCFCVNLLGEVEGQVLCKQMVCVTAPVCTPPCATIVGQNVVCHPDGYLFNLCVTNLQATPVTSIKFTPCTDGQGAPLGPVPSPNPFALPTPLPNGATAYYPFTLPTPGTGGPGFPGGTYCFNVTLCGDPKPGDAHPNVVCIKKICLELPPCNPPCMELSYSNVQCPLVTGGPYTFNLTIKNLSALPVHFLTLSQCPNPPQGCTAIIPPINAINIPGGPLLPGNTATVPVSLPGLPCTGMKACLCVTLFNQEPPDPLHPESPLIIVCKDSICVTLPACPCPPCMSITPGAVLCPNAVGGAYSFTFTITNLQAIPAVLYSAFQCPVPVGSLPVQPLPAVPSLIPGGPLAQNASAPITVTLPVPLTGGQYCFCVALFAADQQTQLCKQQVCVTLPSCRCAEIGQTITTTCLPSGATQVSFNVTNFTNLYPSPYNFDLATFSPASGFTLNSISPNPITPGNTGTVTATYLGPPGNTCVNVIMSNATRTRCCTVKLCFNNPECPLVVSHPDLCDMAPEFICDNGQATLTIYICNNSPFPKTYLWSIMPATVLGCSGNIPAAAYTPSGGLTPTIGANSCVGITCTVNTASLLPGQCAGFQFCFVNSVTPTAMPNCCVSKIVCNRPTDPCIGIGNPHTVIYPGNVIGIPIEFKNPTDAVLETNVVLSDMAGVLSFSRKAFSDGEGDGDGGLISEETPMPISLLPRESYTTTVYATHTGKIKVGTGVIVIGRPCTGVIIDDHYLGSGTVLYGPALAGIATNPVVPTNQAVGALARSDVGGRPAVGFPFHAQPGVFYHIRASQNLDFAAPASAYLLTPASSKLVIQPDRQFTSLYGGTNLDIVTLPFLPKEFYSLSTHPVTVPFNSALSVDR